MQWSYLEVATFNMQLIPIPNGCKIPFTNIDSVGSMIKFILSPHQILLLLIYQVPLIFNRRWRSNRVHLQTLHLVKTNEIEKDECLTLGKVSQPSLVTWALLDTLPPSFLLHWGSSLSLLWHWKRATPPRVTEMSDGRVLNLRGKVLEWSSI